MGAGAGDFIKAASCTSTTWRCTVSTIDNIASTAIDRDRALWS